jgi:fibronectin type 3 domain-containing protein
VSLVIGALLVGVTGTTGVSALTTSVFTDGFESGTMGAWSTVTNVAARSTERHTGTYGARATTTGTPTFAQRTFASTSDVTVEAWFKIVSISTEASVLVVRTATGPLLTLALAKTRKLLTRNAVTGATITSGIAPTAGAWHRLQLHAAIGSPGVQEVWLDGTKVAALSLTPNLGSAKIAGFQIGGTEKNRKFDLVFDDVAVRAPDTTAPSVPGGVGTTVTAPREITVRWNPSTDDLGVASYAVVRDGVALATVPATATSYVDGGLASATTYRYTVAAIDGTGNRSAPSASAAATTPDTQAPSVPVLASATPVAFDRVALVWSASADDVAVAGYGIYRGDVEVATVDGAVTTYTDSSLAGASTYTYRIDAYDAAGNRSATSAPMDATTPPAPDRDPPSPPKNLAAAAVGPREVHLTWTQSFDNIGIASYRVLRDGEPIAQVAPTVDPYVDQTFTDTTVRAGTAYRYTVDAVDDAGNRSDPSEPATVTTPGEADTQPPSAPGSLTAAAPLPNEVDLTWSPATDDRGVIGYRIVRDGATLAEVDATAATYADLSVDPLTDYAYAVRAMDAAGNVSPAVTASASTPALPCDAGGGGLPPDPSGPFRAFTEDSIWNTRIRSAPVDCNSDAMIAWLRSISTTDFVRLAGASSDGRWGNPIYWADASDPAVAVTNTCGSFMPPEFQAIRIPTSALPDDTSDAAMTVYDSASGIVGAFHWTVKTVSSKGAVSWSACGGSVYYLGSNGLEGRAEGTDEPRNFGHRGVPAPTYAVRWDEIQAGAIDHALKIAIDDTCDHVWPMVGDEGCDGGGLIPEGTRIRIKPGIDLSTYDLSAAALTIARALQRYGAYVGDRSGGPIALKLENTVAEGSGFLWNGVLDARSLDAIPLSAYEVVERGWRPWA